MKTCIRCQVEKGLPEFSRSKRSKDGFHYYCKACTRGYHNKDNVRSYAARHPERKLVQWAKQRAKRTGVEFDLTHDDVTVPDLCPVFGTPLVPGDGDNAPTLDRIRNTEGYVRGNVVVVSMRANRMKSDSSVAELRALADFYERMAA